ncbi:7089_t:CDS:2, partial [Scutellospora calospora]
SEEAAKVYTEFVASFEKDEGGGKAFVKGETIIPKGETPAPTTPPKLYKPQTFVPSDEDKQEEKAKKKS